MPHDEPFDLLDPATTPKCRNCGKGIALNAEICPKCECFSPLSESPFQNLQTCAACRRRISKQSVTCPNCGHLRSRGVAAIKVLALVVLVLMVLQALAPVVVR